MAALQSWKLVVGLAKFPGHEAEQDRVAPTILEADVGTQQTFPGETTTCGNAWDARLSDPHVSSTRAMPSSPKAQPATSRRTSRSLDRWPAGLASSRPNRGRLQGRPARRPPVRPAAAQVPVGSCALKYSRTSAPVYAADRVPEKFRISGSLYCIRLSGTSVVRHGRSATTESLSGGAGKRHVCRRARCS